MYGPKTKNSHPVKSKDGVLLTSPQDIQDRWVEHFSELLNQPTDVDMNILDDIEQQPIIDSLNDPITEEELVTALKNTKLGKSPKNKTSAGSTSYWRRQPKNIFTIPIHHFLDNRKHPCRLDPNITILFKKGDRSQCGNYRGISLLSVVGKVFADILLQRLNTIAQKVYPQSQSGYRSGRSTVDGIFAL